MSELTMQRYYDETIAYLLQQEARSVNTMQAQCRYRTPDGNKCAIGYWIPDDLYHSNMEGLGVMRLSDATEYRSLLAGVAWVDSYEGLRLAVQLQSLHDMRSCRDAEDRGGGLSGFGRKQALKIAERFQLVPFEFEEDN